MVSDSRTHTPTPDDEPEGPDFQTQLQVARVIWEAIADGREVTDKQRDELVEFISHSRAVDRALMHFHRESDRLATEELVRLRASHDGLVEALRELVEAKALSKVEELVAGWEGPDKQYARHPANLGARIETTCGRVYDLRDAMVKARRALEAAGITEATDGK